MPGNLDLRALTFSLQGAGPPVEPDVDTYWVGLLLGSVFWYAGGRCVRKGEEVRERKRAKGAGDSLWHKKIIISLIPVTAPQSHHSAAPLSFIVSSSPSQSRTHTVNTTLPVLPSPILSTFPANTRGTIPLLPALPPRSRHRQTQYGLAPCRIEKYRCSCLRIQQQQQKKRSRRTGRR